MSASTRAAVPAALRTLDVARRRGEFTVTEWQVWAGGRWQSVSDSLVRSRRQGGWRLRKRTATYSEWTELPR